MLCQIFDFDILKDEATAKSIRRLQYNANVDDTSIPHMLAKTHMKQTQTLFSRHLMIRVLGGGGVGVTRQAKPKP